MLATRIADADAFVIRAGSFLAAHEAEHNLALGLLGRLRVEPRLYGFTDLANPTSNAIYARIGYEPVADWNQWSFRPLEG